MQEMVSSHATLWTPSNFNPLNIICRRRHSRTSSPPPHPRLIHSNLPSQTLSIVPNPTPNILPGCLVKLPGTAWHPFVFPLIYETFIVVLTVVKAHQLRSRTPVAMRLLRDGTLYYVVIVAVLLVTTIGAADPRVSLLLSF